MTDAPSRFKAGDIIRYGSGVSALFRYDGKHNADRLYGSHVLGGVHGAADVNFFKLQAASPEDLEFCRQKRPEWFSSEAAPRITRDLGNILSVFNGSSGEATSALYAELKALGAAGVVAMELFRAQKASSRAKVYRGGGYKGKAYDKKEWAMTNLAVALAELGSLRWGWKQDPAQEFHNWVLYVDLPNGQVSFHAAARGEGQIYPGEWDGVKNMSATRICRYCADLFANVNADSAGQTPTARSEHEGRGHDLTLQGAAALTPTAEPLMTARHRVANRRGHETIAIEHEDQRYKVGIGRELVCIERGLFGPIIEVFLNAQKVNSPLDVLASDGAILISMLLQYGCPPADIAHSMKRNPDGSPASPLGRAAAFLIEPPQPGE